MGVPVVGTWLGTPLSPYTYTWSLAWNPTLSPSIYSHTHSLEPSLSIHIHAQGGVQILACSPTAYTRVCV